MQNVRLHAPKKVDKMDSLLISRMVALVQFRQFCKKHVINLSKGAKYHGVPGRRQGQVIRLWGACWANGFVLAWRSSLGVA